MSLLRIEVTHDDGTVATYMVQKVEISAFFGVQVDVRGSELTLTAPAKVTANA
jgi:hypothetical protein